MFVYRKCTTYFLSRSPLRVVEVKIIVICDKRFVPNLPLRVVKFYILVECVLHKYHEFKNSH